MSLAQLAVTFGLCAWVCRAPAATPATEPVVTLDKVGEYHLKAERQGTAAVVCDGAIYVVAGGNETGPLSDIERFDPRTQRSEKIFDALLPRRYHRVVEYQGKLYIFGGQGVPVAGRPFEYALEIFDPKTRTVKRGRDMAEARGHMAVARLGNKIVVTGGSKLKDSHIMQSNETDIYDPATDTWTKGVPMPTPREAHAVVVGSMMIVPGGFRGKTALAEVEFFVPQENAWKALPPLSRSISAHSLAHLDKYLFLFGDYADLDLVLAYDLSTRKTHRVKTSFTGVRHTAAVTHDRRIYVIGGNTSSVGSVSDLIQVFALPR